MCLDSFERKSRGFRHPCHREKDSSQADDGEDREGEGETGAGEHQREGEDHEFFLQFSPDGYALGVNVLLYAMTH